MHRKNLDLIVAVIIAVLNVVRVLLHSSVPVVGIILALPLVLALPGYTLTETLFRKRSLKVSERLVLSLGLSLAIDVLSGLFLNVLPVGLQATSWAVLLGLLTVVFSLLVAYRRRGTLANGTQPLRFRLSIYQCILFGLAISVAALSFAYVDVGVIQQPHPGFTQLWMLPEVQAGKSCNVRLGIRSFESTPVTYRITMMVNKTQVTPWPSIVLAPQEEWGHLVPITPVFVNSVYVEAQIYRLDKPQAAYREVHVTLSSCQTSQVTLTRYPGLASAYNGTFHDIPANITTNMSLTGMQQSGGNFDGYFTVGSGLRESGSFRGMITAMKHIKFTVTDNAQHAALAFDGNLQSDGTLAGTYCGLDQGGQCSGDYGLWSVTPAST